MNDARVHTTRGTWSGSWFEQQAVAILAVILLAATLATPALQQAVTNFEDRVGEALSSEVVPEGLTAEEWADIQAQIAALQSSQTLNPQVTVEPVDTPTLRLGRLADASFTTTGATFSFDDHTVRLGTVSVGGPIAAAAPETVDDRVIYDRGTVEEWFIETDRGIEQGWTIAEAPAGVTDELVIEVSAASELIPFPFNDDTIHFLDSTGTVQAQYSGLVAWDADGTDLPATMTYVGNRIEITVDVAGATYPVTVDPTFTEDQTLDAHATSAYARHGAAIDVDFEAALGPIAVVATPGSDVSGTKDIGAVTVLRRTGGSWTVEARLFPNSTDATPTDDDEFAFSVAVRDTRIAVGAPRYDNGGVNAGAVHVYDRDAGTGNWQFSDVLYECSTTPCSGAGQGAPTHRFGASLAFGADASELVIGAPFSARAGSNGGVVYLYRDTGSGLAFQGPDYALANPDLVGSDQFGAAVDTSLDAPGQVLIGAPGANGGNGTAYWADYGANVWSTIDELSLGLTPVAGEALGQDVSLSLQSGAASATYLMAIAAQDRVVLFNADASFGPTQNSENAADDVAFASDASAVTTIDSSKNTVVIGRSVTGAAGAAAVVEWNSGTQVVGSFDPIVNDFAATDDRYGAGIALADTEVLIGAPGSLQSDLFNDLPESGLVTIKPLAGISEPPIGFSTAAQTAVGGRFGGKVVIDGNTMAISSLNADLSAEGAGSVSIYTRPTSASDWVLVDVVTEPASDANTNDRFGWDIAVRNGAVAVSAPNFGTNGQVYVFEEFATNDWRQRGSTINSAAGVNGYWGGSVAFGADENELFIGAFNSSTNGGDGAVFSTTFATDWSAPTVIATPTGDGSNFGADVETAIDGSTLWLGIGDSRDIEFNGNFQGGAFTVLTRPLAGGAWTLETKVGGDYGRGRIIALEPNRVVASSFDEFGIDFIEVFEGPTWGTAQATLSGDQYGSFDLSPSRLAVSVNDGTVALFNLPVSGTLTTPDDIFDPAGATGSMTVGLDDGITVVAGQSDLFSNQGQVYAANFAPSVVYGEPSVDIDGNWAIYGVPADDTAYLLEYSNGAWVVQDQLVGTAGTSFGASVALQDRVITVGAPGDDSAGVDAGTAIQYFRNSVADVDFLGALSGAGQSAGDLFGFSVETNEVDLFVGAPGVDGAAIDNGAVHVFKLLSGFDSSATYDQTIVGGTSGMESGYAIAAAGTGTQRLLAVGAPGIASDGGVVGVYRSLNGGSYTFAELVPISVGAGDRVGEAVDIANLAFNRVAVLVGAPGVGEAYYALIDLNSTFEFVETLSEPVTGYASSVSMSGDSLLVGADAETFSYFARHDGTDRVIASTGATPGAGITDVAIEGQLGLAVPNGTTGTDLSGDNLVGPIPTLGVDDSPATKLFNPVAADYDGFGIVAAEGDTIVVSAPNSARQGEETAGRIYVFKRSAGVISLDQELRSDSSAFGGDLGAELAIGGNVIVASDNTGEVHWYTRPDALGRFSYDTAVNVGFAIDSLDTDGQTLVVGAGGTALVYRGGPFQWDVNGSVTIPNNGVGFARDVAVDGTAIYVAQSPGVISAPLTPADYGNVYVYRDAGAGVPALDVTLTGDRDGTSFSDNFGGSIEADGGKLIVGASYDLDRAGQAYLFDCFDTGDDIICDPEGSFGSDGLQGGEFGVGVAISGDLALVAARMSGGATFGTDSVLLRYVNGTWYRTTALFDAPDVDAIDQYNNIALTADFAVLGGTLEDQFGADAGAATVLPVPPDDEIVNPAVFTSQFDTSGFGVAVDIDGDTMVVGDRFGDADNAGLAYVFDRNADGVWNFSQELDAGFGTGANGGQSVAIDGDRIVIGAPFHNGASEGGIAVFERAGGSWAQDGGILTSPTGGGWLGWDVAIEGSVIVAGAPQRNAVIAGPGVPIGSPNAGGLSIFEENAGTWGFARDLNRTPDLADARVGWAVDISNGDIWSVADFALDRWTSVAHGETTIFTPRGSGGYDDLAATDAWIALGTRSGGVHVFDTSGAAGFLEPFDFAGAGGELVSVDMFGDTIVAVTDTSRLVQVLRNDGGTTFTQVQSGSYDGNGQLGTVAYDGATAALGVEGRSGVRGEGAGSVFAVPISSTPLTPDNPLLQFDLGLGAGQANSINVAPGGIAIADIDAALLAAANDGESTLTASPLGRTEIEDAPLAQLNLEDTPIPQAILNNPDLYNLPLIDVDLDQPGGWTAILEGTPFADRPLQDITLGEVLDATVNPQVAGEVVSLPLGALDVNGTPLGALPLGALVLGDTPLGALPLGALGLDLCTVFADGFPDGTSCTAIEAAVRDLSATEAALQGLPLGALPLGALPLGALPLGALPLSDLPLGALQVEDSPLGALPLGALPLGALGLDSIPLGALPLGALPLGALPLGALGLEGTPLGALPLGALELNGVPLGALDVEGSPLGALPLGALPLGALVLGEEQLSSLPVPEGYSNWCGVLADLETDYDCSVNPNADDLTIAALGLRGVPLGALPLGALPLGALDVNGTPIGALPLGALPLGALPLGALPLGALPLGALPLGALPLGALPLGALPVGATTLADVPLGALEVQGSPLGALPLGALDVTNSPLGALPLGALPLGALPLGALPLGALEVQGSPLGALPLGALDVVSSPLGALPLGALPLGALPLGALDCERVDCDSDTVGDAVLAGALDVDAITFDAISAALGGISIGDLAPYFLTITAEELEAAADASTLTLADLLGFDGVTLGDLPLDNPVVSEIILGDLTEALGGVNLSDLAAALGVSDADMALVLAGFDIGDLENFGDITVGETFSDEAATAGFDLNTLGAFLGFIDLEQMLLAGFGSAPADNGETLGDAVADPNLDLGALTLADLIGLAGVTNYDTLPLGDLLEELRDSDNLLGFVLADLLSALVGLEDVAFGNVDFADVEAGSLPLGTVPDVQFRAGFQVTETVLAQSVIVDVELPATATYVPGTAIVNDGVATTPLEPVVDGNTLQWTVFGVDADEPHLITFDVRPEVTIGSTSLNGRGRVVGTETAIPASAAVTVAEGLEVNDYPATTTVVDDTVYLTYISSTSDLDVFEVTVGERDRLAIQLSNLTVDLDLVLYGIPADTADGSALTATSDEAALDPITNPDATEPVDSEPVEDFPRLDQLYPGDGLQFLDVSNASGTADELIVTEPLPAGTYYVQVHGANGARNQQPATLQIQTLEADSRPECSTLTDILGGALPAAAPGTLPGDLTGNTLFLVNEQRLEQLYGPAGRADVMNSLEALVLYLEANADFGLDPIVVPVEAYAGVASAYAAWDDPINADDACDPEVANNVVSQIITNAVDPIRDQLDHVIIIGGDDIIPMARLQDATTIANEYDYRTELVGDLNGNQGDNVSAFTATFWESRYLSDDPYGETAARSLGDRFLYVPDVSLGRLVEAPAEIASALDHYVSFNGTIDMNTAAVLGYDFLTDSSAEISSDLSAAGLAVDDDLADGVDSTDGEPWDRADAEARLVPPTGSAADLISFNAHFDHYRALPAAGDKVPGFLDNVETSAIADALPSTVLEGTLLFSAGCHGGLSVSDIQIGMTNLDWAQAASQADALWIGNTGFGYGDTETIAYTEQLMSLFAEEVVSPLQLEGETVPTTIGQAFTVAKNRFIAENAALSVYDEKASMEAVFYGLPIYRSGVPAEPAPPAPTNVPSPDATGTPSLVFTVDTDGTLVSTASGDYYAESDADGNEEVISVPGRPVQPKTSEDISVVDPLDPTRLDQVAHGGLILDMTSTYVSLADPVIASVVVDESGDVPEPPVPDSVFPVRPIQITQSTTATGQRQTLSIATGQYRPGPMVQRLDDDIDVNVYYADPSVTDFNAPRIGNVESTVEDGLLTVTLTAADDSNGVDRVYVLFAENPGAGSVDWDGFDLARVGTSDVWAGSVQLEPSTTQLEFIVQAKDGVGNVGSANNKASGFNDDTTPDPEPPTPIDLDADISAGNLDPGGSGWYLGDVVITVTADGDAGYSVDGAPFTPIADGESFTVTGDGIHTVEIETPAGERIAELIRIDTTGAPSFTAGTPVALGSYSNDENNVYDFLCTDPSLVSCDASVGGVPVEVGSPLPTTAGTYVLTVATVDALGNGATYSVPFDVSAPLDNVPEITLLEGPVEPELISDGVTLDITFGDADGAADDYTVTVDWGDLDDLETPGSSTTCTTSSGSPTSGNPSCEITTEPSGSGADGKATASFVYSEPGVYAIEVTLTDSTGNVDTSLYEFAVVYDPAGGRVSGAGWFWSGPEAYAEEEPWGGYAAFGYRARYRNGGDTPIGSTKLKLFGEFFFRSTSYDYLIVNDTIAVAEGSGRIGRDRGYRFRVQGIDNGRHDYFQITIWDEDTGDVLYDNGLLYEEGDRVFWGGIRVRAR